MKWELKEIELGDMVRVPMSEAYHYGVCTGDDRIVEFGEPVLGSPKPANEIRVMAVDIKTFLGGKFAEVATFDRKELKKKKSVEEIVSHAESCIGNGGYDILYNNCEHFANECVFGSHISSQIDFIRQEIEKKLPTIKVYVGKVCDFEDADELPSYAKKALKKITNERVAAEKKAGYGLLSYAAERIGDKSDVKKCFLSDTGKPMHKKFCFSISHAGGMVAVAVASSPVGIDIELRENEERSKRIREKILHENDLMEDTLKLWTVKEAAFKFSGDKEFFHPDKIDSTKFKNKCVSFECDGREYVMSVVSDVVLRVLYNSAPDGMPLKVKN